MTMGKDRALMFAAAGAGAALAIRALVRKANEISMRDRVVLITGGSRGLGLVMARQLAREGARLAICARDDDELIRAQADLRQYGAQAFAVPCDVTVRAQAEGLVQAVQDHFGRIDVLINN